MPATDAAPQIATDQRWPWLPSVSGFERLVDRYRYPLFALLTLAYLLGFNGIWQIEPDSALYLALARNLATGHGYTFRGVTNALAYPGLPVALAAIFALFKSHALFAANVFILTCGLITLAMTYRLVALALDRQTAVVVTLGVGIAHEFFRYCYEIMTDVPFAAGVMAFLAGHEAIFGGSDDQKRKPRWFDWLFFLGGLVVTVTMRPNMIGLVGVWMIVMIARAVRGRKRSRLALTGIAVAVLALAAFFMFDPREHSSPVDRGYENFVRYAFTHRDWLRENVPANAQDLFGKSAARSMFGLPLGTEWLNIIGGSIVLIAGLALWRVRPLWALWIAATLAMMLLIVSHDRYLVAVLPLLVLGWWRFVRGVTGLLPRRIGALVFVALLALGSLPNEIELGGIIYQQHRTPFFRYYKRGRFEYVLELADQLKIKTSRDDIIICSGKDSRIYSFLAERNAYIDWETANLNLSGHRVFIIQDWPDVTASQWLAQHQLTAEAAPLVSIPRPDGHPLELYRAQPIPTLSRR